MAVRNGGVIAMSSDADGLDELVGPATQTIEASGQTVPPGFFDTHNHMLHMALDAGAVQLAGCSTIAELVDAIRSAAAATPSGAWIVPSKGWHESNLFEERLPTRHELDAASSEHPIALRRGGHVMVANTVALDLVSLNEETPDPPGGALEREQTGALTGVLIERPAFAAISALLPPVDRDERVRRLRDQCSVHNTRGITAVRDPGIHRTEFLVYQAAHDNGWLSVRSDVMIRLEPGLGFDGMRAELERWDAQTNLGDARLRLHGVKIFLDGGIESAAMTEDYANQPGYSGHLFLTIDQIVELGEFAVGRGWRIGCHAVGDRAVMTAVDAYERITARHPELPKGWLVIEHALLADPELRTRVVELGIAVGRGADLCGKRLQRCTLRSAAFDLGLVHKRHRISGRSWQRSWDRPPDGLRAPHRGRRASSRRSTQGSTCMGKHADFLLFDTDPLSCDVDDLPHLGPSLTAVGGRVVHRTANVSNRLNQPQQEGNT